MSNNWSGALAPLPDFGQRGPILPFLPHTAHGRGICVQCGLVVRRKWFVACEKLFESALCLLVPCLSCAVRHSARIGPSPVQSTASENTSTFSILASEIITVQTMRCSSYNFALALCVLVVSFYGACAAEKLSKGEDDLLGQLSVQQIEDKLQARIQRRSS